MINKVMSEAKTLHTDLPQGSLLGPFAFPCYTVPLFVIARRHNIQMLMYADDTQLYLPFKPRSYQAVIKQMKGCLADIKSWIIANKLKLNDKKTEFMVIGKKASLQKLPTGKFIPIGGERIVVAQMVKNIGVMIDSQLDTSAQIKSVCRAVYMHRST